MKKILKKMKDGFDLKKQADELGISVWQTPSFLFIIMGLVIIAAMIGDYFIAFHYYSAEALIISETLIVIVLITIGNTLIRDVEQIAISNKMKTEFVSIASHQLKTPLSEISWEIELLVDKNKEGLNSKQFGIIENVSKANERMKKLVNDLLDVSRIDQKRLILMKENFDILKVVKDVVDANSFIARSRGAEISIQVEGEIPEIVGDRRRTRDLFENLISNAVKYIARDGKVEVGIRRETDGIHCWVKDNGIGIPKNQQDQVFEKFFRSDNVARYQTEGTGLGLYIVKNIIDQAGGKIWFVSEEGLGTIFRFTLPLKYINKN